MYHDIEAGGREPVDLQSMSDRLPVVNGSFGLFNSISNGSTE